VLFFNVYIESLDIKWDYISGVTSGCYIFNLKGLSSNEKKVYQQFVNKATKPLAEQTEADKTELEPILDNVKVEEKEDEFYLNITQLYLPFQKPHQLILYLVEDLNIE
jgi:hypothetical protein